MKEYQIIFMKRYIHILEKWKKREVIKNDEIQQLLNDIKDTAMHIELHHLEEIATSLLEEMNKERKADWTEEEWSNFIQPLVLLFDEQTVERSSKLNKSPKRITALLLDNEVGSVYQIKEELEKLNYEVLIATKVKRAIELFYDYHPDLILIHTSMEETVVLYALSKLSERAIESFIPIFVIGNSNEPSLKIKVYDAGATDYIDNAIEYDVLDSLVANRMRQQAYFKKSVLFDELTQAYNRTFLSNVWKNLIKRYKEREQIFSLVLIDLDFFKQVNDRYGHAVGDVVLKNFSSYMLKEKRPSDFFIRYGGEEFILIMPEINQIEALKYTNALLEKFIKTGHHTKDGEIFLSFTAGISEMGEGIATIDRLIEKSDKALYYGKDQGRKRVEVYRYDLEKDPLAEGGEVTLKIAIVDDDRFIRRLLQDKLAKLQIEPYRMEIASFHDGEIFLESNWYKGREKKIVLLDGILPNLDGLDILKYLRQTVNESEIGIMMLSGRQKNSDMVKALELGADDYITKPFSLEQLEARIKRLVHRLFSR
ncbi:MULTISPECIES: diguanylate cyclase [Paraliobacillus]|uniref:GGDEF domain-containing response regulator n=1 Tax=Paraliobacillus TaxID=200903 RepID=UPI000DD31158|nr:MULTISPECIES: diguanylate cyclase [Paraliobacillus]